MSHGGSFIHRAGTFTLFVVAMIHMMVFVWRFARVFRARRDR